MDTESSPEPIPANSIEFEYVYVANQRCLCGGYFSPLRQELRRGPSGPVDRLTARCEKCGSERAFDFDIHTFFGQWEKYGRFHQTEEYFRAAMRHIRTGELREAEAALRRVVDEEEGEPAFAWGHFHLGRLLLIEHRAEEALVHLERAATIQPLEPDIREVLALALEATGQPEAAQAHLRAGADLRARFPEPAE